MAHLLRRAGFSATREELELYCAKGYEAVVEELIHPESQPPWEKDIEESYYAHFRVSHSLNAAQDRWINRMINTKCPLQEKITLFWHGVPCTGDAKVEFGRQMWDTIDIFRKHDMGSFRDLLVDLSKDPGMLFYLDNNMSHKGAINENYGRELLELFSLGVGMDGQSNYTEEDVKVCAQAFTGCTRGYPIPRYPYGKHDWSFIYDADDHDDSEKTFLSERGRFNGEDIIVRQPACARFIARDLYNFFVADEPQIPAWQNTPPSDMEAILTLEKAFVENNYEIGRCSKSYLTPTSSRTPDSPR